MNLSRSQIATILFLGLLGWALCGAIMFVGMSVTTLEITLIVHAIGAPVIFSAISWFTFAKLRYTTPLFTAVVLIDRDIPGLLCGSANDQSLLGDVREPAGDVDAVWLDILIHISDGAGGAGAKRETEDGVSANRGGHKFKSCTAHQGRPMELAAGFVRLGVLRATMMVSPI